MCGVVGIWRHDGGSVDPNDLHKMLTPLTHRGPDDSGVWSDGSLGLGHRRLSIIDLSAAGHQPMLSSDQRGVLSYNGEIYNYRELRHDLEREGVRFLGHSDAEVLLEALHHWGPERTIPLLNGMFAFAYFDRRANTLWLARDRFGIKQLYVAETSREICFASEVKGLSALTRLALPIDAGAVQRRLLGTAQPTATLYSGIRGLASGTWMRVGVEGVVRHRYFDLTSALDPMRLVESDRKFDFRAGTERLAQALQESVDLHLASDSPIAAMCSGGVDSSLIAAYAHDRLPNLVGYVADVPPGSGEGGQAELVGRHIGIPIRRITVERPDYLRLWALAIRHLDGPTYHPSEPALLAVAQACRSDGIKVLLTGEGADELFGGYEPHMAAYKRWRNRRLFGWLIRKGRRVDWEMLPVHSETSSGDYTTGLRRALALDANRYVAPGIAFGRMSAVSDSAHRAFIVNGLADIEGHLAWLLHRHDHMGMAASIEMRVPFIENALIDMALHLPFRAKRRGRQSKWLEKQVARQRLPDRVVFAKKKGFPMPHHYTAGTEQLLVGGLLSDLLGWSSTTTAAVVEALGQAQWLRFDAVALEIWLRQALAGETAEETGERLVALAK